MDISKNAISHKDLKWDYSDPVNGQSLPAPFFYDPEIFEQEKNTHLYELLAFSWPC